MMVLVRQQIASIDVGQPLWALLGLLLPASAAMGNIVRTAFWPKGTSALAFSCATLLASSAIVASLATIVEPPSGWQLASHQLGMWLAALVGVSGLSYVLNYELQYVAGPVSFSQIGYWGAAFGVVLGALIFDDVLGPLSILGIAAIVVGGLIAKRPV
jgi:drug/metabolite transporter (DMT)-like permease